MSRKKSHIASRADLELMQVIADRALAIAPPGVRKIDVLLSLEACHSCDAPLDLERMAEAQLSDLSHDVFGIMGNINRSTGKLENCFVPRFARRAGR